nr:LOW QUALITY PROTEIN: hypothetical protein L204_05996 [Cryptococcus depauperatus CBS 7855]
MSDLANVVCPSTSGLFPRAFNPSLTVEMIFKMESQARGNGKGKWKSACSSRGLLAWDGATETRAPDVLQLFLGQYMGSLAYGPTWDFDRRPTLPISSRRLAPVTNPSSPSVDSIPDWSIYPGLTRQGIHHRSVSVFVRNGKKISTRNGVRSEARMVRREFKRG